MTNNDFYVYEHWRSDIDHCFYVGKGRARRFKFLCRRNPHHKAVQKLLSDQGLKVETRIVASGFSDTESFIIEMERIAYWRSVGTDLTNMTDGGEGPVGRKGKKWGPEFRAKMAAIYAEVDPIVIKERSRKISAALKGKKRRSFARKPHSEETKIKMSVAKKGMKFNLSDEQRAALSKRMSGENNPFFGKSHPPELLRKIAENNRKTWALEETRDKLRNSLKKRRENMAATNAP